MNRTTKLQAYSAFIMLANALGKTVSIGEREWKALKKANKHLIVPKSLTHDYLCVGAWSLTMGPYGTRIEEADNDKGGICFPLGTASFTLSEFFDATHFALNVLRLKE